MNWGPAQEADKVHEIIYKENSPFGRLFFLCFAG